ncbi:hypothetical protein BB561_002825 [Smittium simulii]|uniref:Bromo domain-containing protein n=1 Tax=Smittium simulii TaxID=133385 RepID=A0A2T9YP18_9FUNG|nr:hypothetical protein BB561_002825 [Smittium simulii]
MNLTEEELNFLIAKYLTNGPLKSIGLQLQDVLSEKSLLPTRVTWTGKIVERDYVNMEKEFDDVPNSFLLDLFKKSANVKKQPLSQSTVDLIFRNFSPRNNKYSISKRLHFQSTSLPHLTLNPAERLPLSVIAKYKQLVRCHGHKFPTFCVLFDRNNRRMFTGSDDYLIKSWCTRTGYLIHTFRGHKDVITDMSLNVENTLIASGSSDGTIRIWDLKSGKNEAVLYENLGNNKKGITGVKFSPSPIPEIRYLAALNEDGLCFLYKWNRDTIEFHKKPIIIDGKQTRGDNISSFTFNKSGSMLALSTKNGYIHIMSFITAANENNCFLLQSDSEFFDSYNNETTLKDKTLETNPEKIDLQDANENNLNSNNLENTLLKSPQSENLNWGHPQILNIFLAHSSSISTLVYSNQDLRLLSSAVDGSAYIWEFDKLGNVTNRIFVGVGDPFSSINFLSPANSFTQNANIQALANQNIAQTPNTAEIPESNQIATNFSQPRVPIEANQVAWVCDDSIVLVSNSVGVVSAFNSISGKKLWSHRGHGEMEVFVLETHPTDPRIAFSGGYNGTVVLWDVKFGVILQRFILDEQIFDGSFSEDGSFFAVAGETGAAYLFGNSENEKQYRDASRMPEQMFLSDYTRTVHDAEYFVIDEISQLAPHLMDHGSLYDFDGRQYRIQKGSKFGMDIDYGLNNSLLKYNDFKKLHFLRSELQDVELLYKHVNSQFHKARFTRKIAGSQGNTVGLNTINNDSASNQTTSYTNLNAPNINSNQNNVNESEDDIEFVISEDENENVIVHQYRRGVSRQNTSNRTNIELQGSTETGSYTRNRRFALPTRNTGQSQNNRSTRSNRRRRRNRRNEYASFDEDGNEDDRTSLDEFVINDEELEYFDDAEEEDRDLNDEVLGFFDTEAVDQQMHTRALRSRRPLTRAQTRPTRNIRNRQASITQNIRNEDIVRGATRAQTNLIRSRAVNRRDPATRRNVLESLRRRRQERNINHLSGEESSIYVSNTRNTRNGSNREINSNSNNSRQLRRPRMNLRSMDNNTTENNQDTPQRTSRRAGLRSDTSTRASHNRSIISDESSNDQENPQVSNNLLNPLPENTDDSNDSDTHLSPSTTKKQPALQNTKVNSVKRHLDELNSSETDSENNYFTNSKSVNTTIKHSSDSDFCIGSSKSMSKKAKNATTSYTHSLRSKSAISPSSDSHSSNTPPQTTRSGRLVKRSWKLEYSDATTLSKQSPDIQETSKNAALTKKIPASDQLSHKKASENNKNQSTNSHDSNSMTSTPDIPKTIKIKFSANTTYKNENMSNSDQKPSLACTDKHNDSKNDLNILNSINHDINGLFNLTSSALLSKTKSVDTCLDYSTAANVNDTIASSADLKFSVFKKSIYKNKNDYSNDLESLMELDDSYEKGEKSDSFENMDSNTQLLSWTICSEPLIYHYKPQVGDEIVYIPRKSTESGQSSLKMVENDQDFQNIIFGQIIDLKYKIIISSPRKLLCEFLIKLPNIELNNSQNFIEFIRKYKSLNGIDLIRKQSFEIDFSQNLYNKMMLYSKFRGILCSIITKNNFNSSSKIWMILSNDTAQLGNFNGFLDKDSNLLNCKDNSDFLSKNPLNVVSATLSLESLPKDFAAQFNNRGEKYNCYLSAWEMSLEDNPKILMNSSYHTSISQNYKKKVKEIISVLIESDEYVWFEKTVDFEEYPTYLTLISYPMCFDLIIARIEKNYYRQLSSIHRDLYQIYENATTFNDPKSAIYLSAVKMVFTYIDKLKEYNLESTECLINFESKHSRRIYELNLKRQNFLKSKSQAYNTPSGSSGQNSETSPQSRSLRRKKNIRYNDDYISSDSFETPLKKPAKLLVKTKDESISAVKNPSYKISTESSDSCNNTKEYSKSDFLDKDDTSPNTRRTSLRRAKLVNDGIDNTNNTADDRRSSNESKLNLELERKKNLRKTTKSDNKYIGSDSSFTDNSSDFSDDKTSNYQKKNSNRYKKNEFLTNVEPHYAINKRKISSNTIITEPKRKKKATKRVVSDFSSTDDFENGKNDYSDASSSSFHP